MTLTRDMHYAKVEALRQAALAYRHRFGTSYFKDLSTIHQDLGLAFGDGSVQCMAYLTPIKEKEVQENRKLRLASCNCSCLSTFP